MTTCAGGGEEEGNWFLTGSNKFFIAAHLCWRGEFIDDQVRISKDKFLDFRGF